MKADSVWVVAMGFIIASWFAEDTITWLFLSIFAFGIMVLFAIFRFREIKLEMLQRMLENKRWEVVLNSLYDIEQKLERLKNVRRKTAKK